MPSSASRSPRHKRFSNSLQHLLISLALIGGIGLVVAAVVLLSPEKQPPSLAQALPLEETPIPSGYDVNCITDSIPPEVFSQEFPQYEADTFTYRLNRTPYWQDGALHDLYFENPSGNFYNMRADIALTDGTAVYRSGVITPNQYIQEIPMETAPANSTVKAVVTIAVFKGLDSSSPIQTFTEEIEILILT